MKKVPIEILTAWAEKMGIKLSSLEKMLDKYEVQLTKYDGKFDDIYEYLHEQVLKEKFGINKQLEIDTFAKEDRILILSIISEIGQQFYNEGLSENQRDYFFQLIKSFKIGYFEEKYSFEYLNNIDSSKLNEYLYKTIREFIFLGEEDKFDNIKERVTSYINISDKVKKDIDEQLERIINIFGKEILTYRKGTSFLEKKQENKSKFDYSLEKFNLLKGENKTFSSIKIINDNLTEAEIIDIIIEYQLNLNSDNVLAIAFNHKKEEMFNGIIFLYDGIFILNKSEKNYLIEKTKELSSLLEKSNDENLSDLEIELIEKLKISLHENIQNLSKRFNSRTIGNYILYKDIELLDVEDIENNSVEKIIYRNNGTLTGVEIDYLSEEVREIIYYFAILNGNSDLRYNSEQHNKLRKKEFEKAQILEIFGRVDISIFQWSIYKYYKEKLKTNSSWCTSLDIKTEQVYNINKLIDTDVTKENIYLFCDFAPLKKDGKEGMVITENYIVARDYYFNDSDRLHKVYFNDIKDIKFSEKRKAIFILLRDLSFIFINTKDSYNEHYSVVLKKIFEIWKECNGK